MTGNGAHSWLVLMCIKVYPKPWFPKFCVCYLTSVRMISKLHQFTSEREQDGVCKIKCSDFWQLLIPVSWEKMSQNLDFSCSIRHLTHVWVDHSGSVERFSSTFLCVKQPFPSRSHPLGHLALCKPCQDWRSDCQCFQVCRGLIKWTFFRLTQIWKNKKKKSWVRSIQFGQKVRNFCHTYFACFKFSRFWVRCAL